MTTTLNNKSFSVRISFDNEGNPVIGSVLGFFSVDADCYDILPVPDATILLIAQSLHVTRSSKTRLVNRKMCGKRAESA